MIFPEDVLYDYSAFGTTKTADIYTLKQLIDTPNSTMVPPRGVEPLFQPSEGCALSIELWGRIAKIISVFPLCGNRRSVQKKGAFLRRPRNIVYNTFPRLSSQEGTYPRRRQKKRVAAAKKAAHAKAFSPTSISSCLPMAPLGKRKKYPAENRQKAVRPRLHHLALSINPPPIDALSATQFLPESPELWKGRNPPRECRCLPPVAP